MSLSGLAAAQATRAADAAPDPVSAVTHGSLILEERTRFESVDQSGLTKRGSAFTTRTRLGWKTAPYEGLVAIVELEDIRRIGPERYNVAVPGPGGASLNGKTAYPTINDPQTTELNRAQIAWTPTPALTLTAGRQRILIDDQRFVGDATWRQDEQTFDAGRADVTLGAFKATYAWLGHINRVLGQEKDWDSNSHLVNASYRLAEPLTLEGFVYALDFENSKANSSLTSGARLTGRVSAGPVRLAYSATSAREIPYANQPARFNLGYAQGDLAATVRIWTVKADYEVLEGNGVYGFFTPLNSPHPFQGWADAFAQAGGNKSFPDGIKDLNLSLAARPPLKTRFFSNPELFVRWHDFDAERTGAALGQEWDLQGTGAITPHLSALLKYAQYVRPGSVPAGTAAPPASRTKVWAGLEFKL